MSPREGNNSFKLVDIFKVFLLIPLFIGILGASIALPSTVFAKAAIDAGTSFWDSIEVDPSVFDIDNPEHVKITDRNGVEFATLYVEDRETISDLEEVSPSLIDTIISTEDRRFFEGSPIDYIGVARSIVTGSGGGSGIVQQQAKLVCSSSGACIEGDEKGAAMSDRTIFRKVVEIKYAVDLSREKSSEEILIDYLNSAYFGNGAYGVRSAAKRYFSAIPEELSLEQSAMLAGLLKSPVGFDPTINPEDAKNRRDTVLIGMVDNAKTTNAEIADILGTEVELDLSESPNGCDESSEPYFCDYVKRILLSDPVFGGTEEERQSNLDRGGFTVRTSLDLGV